VSNGLKVFLHGELLAGAVDDSLDLSNLGKVYVIFNTFILRCFEGKQHNTIYKKQLLQNDLSAKVESKKQQLVASQMSCG
jgi:hypothetical protein